MLGQVDAVEKHAIDPVGYLTFLYFKSKIQVVSTACWVGD